MPRIITGWLLDIYAAQHGGLSIWLLEEAGGLRTHLKQLFPTTFYAAGPGPRLRTLWRYLENQNLPLTLERTQRRDLFQPNPVTVLAVQVHNPIQQPRLFFRVSAHFPDLTYYDADIPLPLRHAAAYGTFPLAKVQAQVDDQGVIQDIHLLDTPWMIDSAPPPLRTMRIEPDHDPRHASPRSIHIQVGRREYRFSLATIRPLLVNLAAVIQRHDPDLLLTAWGDTWLLPFLLEKAQELGIRLPLNRDPEREVVHKAERSYQAYGRVIHRGRQVYLFGRWHIDMYNAVMFHDYGLAGILESARVTSLPVEQAARLSPGTGISSMQMITALRHKVLIPWHKQQAEQIKTAPDLLRSDQGGLVYQPLIGLHRDVAEIDFISMYPSIMERFNISPEPVGKHHTSAAQVPALNLWVDQKTPGLIPLTLEPLLEKRIALKEQIAVLPRRDPRRRVYKAMASAHKWLLVTCFGYLGYKNARFGRIEAHQAVTAYSRECLLRAKEAAEDADYTVLHMYVDGLWVQKPGCRRVEDLQPLLDEILDRTHLPIALEGVYRWVAFLPSRLNGRVPVPNRYFGVFQDGSIKVRGIEARRGDTPPFIAQAQMEILERLAQVEDPDRLSQCLPEIVFLLQERLKLLRARRIALTQLLVAQKLSRALEEYRTPSPSARAAAQLAKVGKHLRPGQQVRFLYTIGAPGVYAWDLPDPPNLTSVDTARYSLLFLRAAAMVLQPLGISERILRDWLFSNAGYGCQPGEIPSRPAAEIPLLADQRIFLSERTLSSR